ncbi:MULTISPECIES: phage holin family protein [Metabacillus]|uniref:Phage holin family protein n=1 Tax=Metabacillus hrfriensis TaxID=3048891 RepID=A0ACD4R8X3_9BACI|nr:MULTISPECIES: phage holin family protein [Metabacillus]UAL51422.1 phage holin family protein [Metabacillus dongyingensis]USK27724.1 phage holin family protein [Bacillus sp. CMF21]WHZ56928.1 phage holin family protein [Metabacillus sp. CT-WN-B3]
MSRPEMGLLMFTSIYFSVLTFIVGELHEIFLILLSLMFIELVTFILADALTLTNTGNLLRNSISRLGAKVIIISVVAVANLIDLVLNTNYLLRDGTICFYIVFEALRILRNAHNVKLPVPKFLIRILEFIEQLFKK